MHSLDLLDLVLIVFAVLVITTVFVPVWIGIIARTISRNWRSGDLEATDHFIRKHTKKEGTDGK